MKIPLFVKYLAKFCASEYSGYALGGVQCVSDGTTAQLTATDGHILANVAFKDDDAIKMNVVADAKRLSSAPAKAFSHSLGVRFDGKSLGGAAECDVPLLDGRFPRIEDVFKQASDSGYVAVQVDAALLRKLCDLSHAMNDDHQTKGITLFVKDATSCVFATTSSTDGHVARLAIMPRAPDGEYKPAAFPQRPGTVVDAKPAAAESVVEEEQPAPPPEFMDDEQVAAAIAEPADWSVDLAPI